MSSKYARKCIRRTSYRSHPILYRSSISTMKSLKTGSSVWKQITNVFVVDMSMNSGSSETSYQTECGKKSSWQKKWIFLLSPRPKELVVTCSHLILRSDPPKFHLGGLLFIEKARNARGK